MAECCQNRAKNGIGEEYTFAFEHTLKQAISFSGRGLFTGEMVSLVISPAEPGSGISFCQIDHVDRPVIPATVDYVVSTPRCTILGKGGVTIHTVEHLLAALRGSGIDNAFIELSGPEVPIMDGSSAPFVEGIEKGGKLRQEKVRKIHRFSSAITFSDGDTHLIALPSEEMKISYTMHFPHSPFLGTQYHSAPLHFDHFAKHLAPSRTFCLHEEIAPLIEKGLLKGGGLDSGVVISGDRVLNPGGLRFADEMVCHKILDLFGDLALIPPFLAHVIAICSGHKSNIEFAKKLRKHMMETP